MASKKVKFNYYAPMMDFGTDADPRFAYFTDIVDLFTDLIGRDPADRRYNIKDGRFMWLDTFEQHSDTVWHGRFGSALKGDRPNIIDTVSLAEDGNPIPAGKAPKANTYFSIHKENNEHPEVHIFIQANFKGVNSTHIQNYITHFLMMRLTPDETLGFSIDIQPILRSDFINDARSMRRVSEIKVHYDKSICGNIFQSLTDSYQEMKDEVVIAIGTKRMGTILAPLERIYNEFKLNNANMAIREIKVIGYDANNAKVTISTEEYLKCRQYDVDYDPLTRILDHDTMVSCSIGIANGF